MSQNRLVHIVDEVPELEEAEEGVVLLVALEGFLDAGNATALSVAHLTAAEPGRVVASFEVDELHDYRARRPPMTFREDRYADYQAPRLNVRLLRDADRTAYLLLSGPEPDVRWEAWARAVREVVEALDVRLVVALGSIPMAAPHTRPVELTCHGVRPGLVTRKNMVTGEIRVPASAQALLELRLGEWDHDAMGYVAHIPHYVAQADYPDAAVSLLRAVGESTGLRFDVAELERAGAQRQAEIEQQLSDAAEVRDVVAGLEQQYDAYHRGKGESLLAGEDEPLPSGEELGEQFERFLAGLDPRDRPDEGGE